MSDGVDCNVHALPFHRYARPTSVDDVKLLPTASHADTEKQETDVRFDDDDGPGEGTVLMDQVVPFQISTRGNC